ncbi:hypothetical protein GCM10012285_19950 [Streptomyces kronopolitis]|uniref:Secreted protein n=1 Tax=Streptomyces kronopolitis TaxID=1612435 RepID=A0ABQ2J6B3_9ACTN|nr:hypothetical protein GCM10012285_19950 [Streptomyces kronopolitis]
MLRIQLSSTIPHASRTRTTAAANATGLRATVTPPTHFRRAPSPVARVGAGYRVFRRYRKYRRHRARY